MIFYLYSCYLFFHIVREDILDEIVLSFWEIKL
jgi:hypothetical protein